MLCTGLDGTEQREILLHRHNLRRIVPQSFIVLQSLENSEIKTFQFSRHINQIVLQSCIRNSEICRQRVIQSFRLPARNFPRYPKVKAVRWPVPCSIPGAGFQAAAGPVRIAAPTAGRCCCGPRAGSPSRRTECTRR
jgi:hypothetical protein